MRLSASLLTSKQLKSFKYSIRTVDVHYVFYVQTNDISTHTYTHTHTYKYQ